MTPKLVLCSRKREWDGACWSSVLAQRADSEGLRWTPAVGDYSGHPFKWDTSRLGGALVFRFTASPVNDSISPFHCDGLTLTANES